MNLIVCVDKNWAIGHEGQLLVHFLVYIRLHLFRMHVKVGQAVNRSP